MTIIPLKVPPPMSVIDQVLDERREHYVQLLDRKQHEAARRSLAEFTAQMWPTIEPGTPLVWNWHLDILCDALERQIRGEPEYRKLAFFVPPGTMKSILVAVMAPAWEWLENPARRKITFSHDGSLATRDSRRMRNLITSDRYRAIANYCAQRDNRDPWGLSRDQNEKVNFENTARGFRECLSLGAAVTGKRGDDVIIDDPHDAKEVVIGSVEQIAKRMKEAKDVYQKVLASRVNNLAEARWTMIMQRVHDSDLGAVVSDEEGWTTITIRMEHEIDDPDQHWEDPREEPGELMFPARFPQDELDALRSKLENDYSAQYQQRPLPRGGGALKRWYWRFWYPRDTEPPPPVRVTLPDGTIHECVQQQIPAKLTGHTQSWDMAFKDTRASAYVVGQLWARDRANHYLLDQIRDKLDINASIEAVRLMTKRYPQGLRKLIEDKANGPAIIAMLRNEIAGLIEVEPMGGKEARMNAAAPLPKAGNCYLPHPTLHPWVYEFLNETEAAPGCAYWDQVDAFSQYVCNTYLVGDSSAAMVGLGTQPSTPYASF